LYVYTKVVAEVAGVTIKGFPVPPLENVPACPPSDRVTVCAPVNEQVPPPQPIVAVQFVEAESTFPEEQPAPVSVRVHAFTV
jgi:hypothetical protein